MSTLFFFTGENAFGLREERKRWKDEFGRKHGAENIVTLDGPRTPLRTLLDETGTAPFGADKRLVFIEGTPKLTKEEVEVLAHAQHPDCLVVIVDPAPDKRTAAAKAFLATATVKEFTPLTGSALKTWLTTYAKELLCTLDAGAVSALLEIVGEDQDMLARELEKLAMFAGGKTLKKEDVDRLCVPAGDKEVWALTSLLTRGDPKTALAFLQSSAQRGGDAFSYWNVLLWLLRSTVAVHAVTAGGEHAPARVAQLSGVAFPTVRSLQSVLPNITKDRLASLVSWATDADIALKTGGYRASSDAQHEIAGLLELLVTRLCALYAGRATS